MTDVCFNCYLKVIIIYKLQVKKRVTNIKINIKTYIFVTRVLCKTPI